VQLADGDVAESVPVGVAHTGDREPDVGVQLWWGEAPWQRSSTCRRRPQVSISRSRVAVRRLAAMMSE
jgi:hypothetical protein